jgi:hypothetical protein
MITARTAAAHWPTLLAGSLAIFRALCTRPADWWRDWILILCIIVIASESTRGRKSWGLVLMAGMGWLSGIYLLRQGGAAVGVLGLLP